MFALFYCWVLRSLPTSPPKKTWRRRGSFHINGGHYVFYRRDFCRDSPKLAGCSESQNSAKSRYRITRPTPTTAGRVKQTPRIKESHFGSVSSAFFR